MRVGVIGLGKVGAGICTALTAAGHDVVGYDISEEARERVAGDGVDVVDSNGAVAEAADTIVLSLPHPDASREVMDGIVERAASETVVLDTSTLSPRTARDIHDAARPADVYYHDCPITGGAVGAERGELTMMAGGDPDRLRAAEPMLEDATERVYHIGDVGDAQFVKLVHNQVGQTVLLIFVESLFLADEWGVDPAVLYRTLRHYTQIYDDKLDAFFGNEFPDDFDEFVPEGTETDVRLGPDQQFNLREAHKDLVEVTDLAAEFGTPYPTGGFAEQRHRTAMRAGYGDRPHPDMLDMFESLFDRDVESRDDRRAKSRGRIV